MPFRIGTSPPTDRLSQKSGFFRLIPPVGFWGCQSAALAKSHPLTNISENLGWVFQAKNIIAPMCNMSTKSSFAPVFPIPIRCPWHVVCPLVLGDGFQIFVVGHGVAPVFQLLLSPRQDRLVRLKLLRGASSFSFSCCCCPILHGRIRVRHGWRRPLFRHWLRHNNAFFGSRLGAVNKDFFLN